MLGQLLDLRVGETAVGFANDTQRIASFFITHCKGVVAQHMAAFAVALLRLDHHHIQRGQGLLQFEPRLAATPRRVGAQGILCNQPFIAPPARGMEGGLDLRRTAHLYDLDQAQPGRQRKGL